jgi:hypothetical protein
MMIVLRWDVSKWCTNLHSTSVKTSELSSQLRLHTWGARTTSRSDVADALAIQLSCAASPPLLIIDAAAAVQHAEDGVREKEEA